MKFKALNYSVIIIIAGILTTIIIGAGANSKNPDESTLDIKKAISKSLSFLAKDGSAWMEGRITHQNGQGCVSCHQVGFGIWGFNEAERQAISVNDSQFEQLAQKALDFVSRPRKGRVMSWVPLILAYDNLKKDFTMPRIREFMNDIVSKQQPSGYWRARGQFPSQNRPSKESDAVATLWTVLALSSIDHADKTILGSINKALNYIANSEAGESNEWLLTRLLVEKRFGEPEVVQTLLEKLLRQQHTDGGWSWLSEDESNAFSTGQTLYALNRVGIKQNHLAIQSGVQYLLQTQASDGTWLVDSDLTSREGNEGKDYVYKYWGTAWATIGLARSIPGSENSFQEAIKK